MTAEIAEVGKPADHLEGKALLGLALLDEGRDVFLEVAADIVAQQPLLGRQPIEVEVRRHSGLR